MNAPASSATIIRVRKSAVPVRPKPHAAAITSTSLHIRKAIGARRTHRAQSCPQYNATHSTSTTASGTSSAGVAIGPIMNRNVKKSVASARTRSAIAAVTLVLVVATGFDEVISPPSRARLNCEEGIYSNDLLTSLKVTRLTRALVFEPTLRSPSPERRGGQGVRTTEAVHRGGGLTRARSYRRI